MNKSTATLTPWPVRLNAADVVINGDLSVPAGARGLIVFAHGSGSSRHSPRNQAVAEVLQHGKLATLLLDLLTPGEERADMATAEFRFDIPLLASRVVSTVDWTRTHAPTQSLPLGL